MVKKYSKHDSIEYDFLEHILRCPLLNQRYTDFYINKEIKNKAGSRTYIELDLLLFQKGEGIKYYADVFEIKSGDSMKAYYKACSQMKKVDKHWHNIFRVIGYSSESIIEPHYYLVYGSHNKDYHNWKVKNLDDVVNGDEK